MGANVGHCNQKKEKSCGCQCRPLQGEKIVVGTNIRPKKNKSPKSRIKWGSTLLRANALLLTLLLSFLHCCFFLCHVVFLIVLLFSSLPYCSPLHITQLFFSHCCSHFQMFFYFKQKVLCVVVLLFVLLFFYFKQKVLCVVVFLFVLLCFPHCVVIH